jgi:hypothetical protein
MLSGGQISAFFALSVTTSLKIPGAVIPRNVFTQPRPSTDIRGSTLLLRKMGIRSYSAKGKFLISSTSRN